jgi:hypothetical protein
MAHCHESLSCTDTPLRSIDERSAGHHTSRTKPVAPQGFRASPLSRVKPIHRTTSLWDSNPVEVSKLLREFGLPGVPGYPTAARDQWLSNRTRQTPASWDVAGAVRGWRREWDSCPVTVSEASRAVPEDHSLRQDRAERGNGGESGIRTLSCPLDSVTYKFHNARVAVDASNAVAPCPLLPARMRFDASRRR